MEKDLLKTPEVMHDFIYKLWFFTNEFIWWGWEKNPEIYTITKKQGKIPRLVGQRREGWLQHCPLSYDLRLKSLLILGSLFFIYTVGTAQSESSILGITPIFRKLSCFWFIASKAENGIFLFACTTSLILSLISNLTSVSVHCPRLSENTCGNSFFKFEINFLSF